MRKEAIRRMHKFEQKTDLGSIQRKCLNTFFHSIQLNFLYFFIDTSKQQQYETSFFVLSSSDIRGTSSKYFPLLLLSFKLSRKKCRPTGHLVCICHVLWWFEMQLKSWKEQLILTEIQKINCKFQNFFDSPFFDNKICNEGACTYLFIKPSFLRSH